MSKEDIYYKKVQFSMGDINILGTEKFIFSILLTESINKTFETSYKKGTTKEMEKAVKYLHDYFSINKKNISIKWETSFNLEKKYKNDKINLNIESFTETEKIVYRELIKIQWGDVISYGSLSALCSIEKGGRFIGNTVAKNLFPILIPCHRVIRSDGKIGNYTGGVDKKVFLLKHEKAIISYNS